jgi:hypothetical protein
VVSAGSGSNGGRVMLTITEPTGSPLARSSTTASTVSCTGISSSSVTTCTAVWDERSTAMTPSLCDLTGPTLASPATSAVTLRKRVIRPVGGASTTTASYTRRPFSVRVTASFTLPVSSTSRIPGAMVVAKSIAPSLFSARPARRRL